MSVAGLLTGRRATTNKLAFDWVASLSPAVPPLPLYRRENNPYHRPDNGCFEQGFTNNPVSVWVMSLPPPLPATDADIFSQICCECRQQGRTSKHNCDWSASPRPQLHLDLLRVSHMTKLLSCWAVAAASLLPATPCQHLLHTTLACKCELACKRATRVTGIGAVYSRAASRHGVGSQGALDKRWQWHLDSSRRVCRCSPYGLLICI